MAEIKVDIIKHCNVSSPKSCNSSNLNKINSNDPNLTANSISNENSNCDQQPNIQHNSSMNHIHDKSSCSDDHSNKNDTARFYVNFESKNNQTSSQLQSSAINESKETLQTAPAITEAIKTENELIDDQNETIDQFNDFFHFDRREFSNEASTSTCASNNKCLESNFISNEDIGQVLKAFQDKSFKSGEQRAKDEKIQFMCLNLFNYDYKPEELMIINNYESDLSSSYPTKIIVPRTDAFSIDTERLRNLIMKAKYARCRCRFPVPVILFNNKYVCRSATLSHCLEIYSRQSYASFFKTSEDEQIQDIGTEISENQIHQDLIVDDSPNFDLIETVKTDECQRDNEIASRQVNKSNSYFSAFKQDYSHTVDEARTQDMLLLNYLNVKHIIDLMVEMKKLKYGLYVASSEKADKLNRYRDFNVNVLPYPGCEFFKSYRDNNYQAEGLVYDWSLPFVDADLNLIQNETLDKVNIDFNNYQKWDLIQLTLNYLKLILTYLVEPTNESILLHCISGWDRTSEFVSLVRLSLWADYELHQNLNYEQILYLTLGYDWYLFGHDLSDRVEKGEEIMHFCFYFLKFLSSTEYSIDYLRKKIVKQGDNYVRVVFDCCGECQLADEQQTNRTAKVNRSSNDEAKLSVHDLDDEINSSMYSSQASTVVNNNLRKDRIVNQFDGISDDECEPKTPNNIKFDTDDAHQQVDLLSSSVKTFTFDQNISSSPSSFSAFKGLRNICLAGTNSTSLNIERDSSDLNKFDVISLDDQSLSSNSSFDVLNGANKQQQITTNAPQSSSNRSNVFITSSPNQVSQVKNQLVKNSQQSPQSLKKINTLSNNKEFACKDNNFSCGTPPQMLSNIMTAANCCEIANEATRNRFCEDDFLSSSGESSTLAEDTVESRSNDSHSTTSSNIQRSNAMAIPARNSNRQSNNNIFNSSNNSDLSNASHRFSDQSFDLNRCDSWQIVTGTGSVKDKNFLSSSNSLEEMKRNLNSKSNSSPHYSRYSTSQHHSGVGNGSRLRQTTNHFSHNYVPTCCCRSLNCGKHCEKIARYNKENDLERFVYTRKKRLSDVRVVFYQCYSKYIGLSTANGQSGNEITIKFSNLINKTCEKIKYPFRTGSTSGNGLTRNSSTRLSNRKSSFQSYIEDNGDLDMND